MQGVTTWEDCQYLFGSSVKLYLRKENILAFGGKYMTGCEHEHQLWVWSS